MHAELTEKQFKLLKFIYSIIKDTGFPPSMAELRTKAKLASNQSVINFLRALEQKGFIAREEGVARALRILPKGYQALGAEQMAPVVGNSSCGPFVEAIEEVGKWMELPGTVWKNDVRESQDKFYVIEVHGDSMINAGIYEGDKLLIKQSHEYKNGDIVVARGDDGTTVKRFVHENKRVYLKPENPTYKNIPFYDDLFLDGKVVANLSTMRRLCGSKADNLLLTVSCACGSSKAIKDMFRGVLVDKSWAFSDKTRKDTAYITHGYHRYPAKFIPQIVSRLAEKYTKEGDLIVDPFGGCGTTLVESKVMGRPSVGVDINPVAVLIAKAKITQIDPVKIEKEFAVLKNKLETYSENTKVKAPEHERIDYWFKPEEKRKLAFIFFEISKVKDQDVQDFFFCGFSNILKNCSIWLQKSNKPTRDFEKEPSEPIKIFFKQIKMMMRGNAQLFKLLSEKGYLKIPCKVVCTDARTIPAKDDSVSLIVTSPPYVTSYEYADLHQLTALWLEYTKDLNDFRKRFIGTSYHNKKDLILNSAIAENIRSELLKKDKKTAEEVSTYFSEMNQVFIEMKRILKKGGKTCIVVGNTSLKGVEILNAEVFTEQLQNLGLKVAGIIKREIPSKNLPSVRDEKTGRFAGINDKNKVSVYPTEYILMMEKI